MYHLLANNSITLCTYITETCVVQEEKYAKIFLAALSLTSRSWKQPKYLSKL